MLHFKFLSYHKRSEKNVSCFDLLHFWKVQIQLTHNTEFVMFQLFQYFPLHFIAFEKTNFHLFGSFLVDMTLT